MISTRHYTKEAIADVLDSEYRRPNPLVNDYMLFPVRTYVHKIISIRGLSYPTADLTSIINASDVSTRSLLASSVTGRKCL
jgi:hypothetical protein